MPPSARSRTPPFCERRHLGRRAAARLASARPSSSALRRRRSGCLRGCGCWKRFERVRFAVVADDQQIVWTARAPPERRRHAARGQSPRRASDGDRGHRQAGAAPRRSRRSARCSGTGIDPNDSTPIVKPPQRERRRPPTRCASRRSRCSAIGAEPVHDARCRETSSSCTPRRARPPATSRSDRDRARPRRRRSAIRSCSPMSTTARASSRARVCCCASDSSGVEEADLVHQVGRVARPAFRHRAAEKHADPAGAVDGGDPPDLRRARDRRSSSARGGRSRRGERRDSA